jgi:peptide deformylase
MRTAAAGEGKMTPEAYSMAILPIVRLGHPALRTPAEAVSPERVSERAFRRLVDDMFETMRDAGGVGLAAPQVGFGMQLFVYGTSEVEGGRSVPLRVVINPMVEPEPGELVYDWEGCLSIPDLRGLVPRHPAVRVRGLDREGASLDFLAEGFEARIVQHEFDHLNGVLFLDRMRDLQSLAFYDEWERYLQGEEPGRHPVPPE